ncbi:unnamed protein product [Sphagnum balticum]
MLFLRTVACHHLTGSIPNDGRANSKCILRYVNSSSSAKPRVKFKVYPGTLLQLTQIWNASPTGQAYGRPTNSPSMNSKLVRPTASVPTAPVKIDEAKEMSHLSLGLSPPEPSQLTLKLLDPPSRHSSAFQVNSSFNSSSISPSSNAMSVV